MKGTVKHDIWNAFILVGAMFAVKAASPDTDWSGLFDRG